MCWQSCATHLTHVPGFTHTHAFTHVHTRLQKHPNTLCDTAVVAAGVDVCEDSSSLSRSFLFLCVAAQRRGRTSEEKKQNTCVCVSARLCTHNTSCVTTCCSPDPPELSSWVWEGCHHIPEAGSVTTCYEPARVMDVCRRTSHCIHCGFCILVISLWFFFTYLFLQRNLPWVSQIRCSRLADSGSFFTFVFYLMSASSVFV